MREFICFALGWPTAICVGLMCLHLVGFGHPNCEPTTAGYVAFYATMFLGSVGSVVVAWLGLGVIILARNCMRAMR
jgi:hypothetical protein